MPSPAAIDLRSLAVFRMGLGFLVALDQAVALGNARVFYSDAGLLPRDLLHTHFADSPWMLSVHTLSGSTAWQAVLILLGLAAGVAVALGWRTRPALVIGWALLCSLQVRNPTILYGGDTALRLLCFWGLFLPLDACWSLAARRSATPAPAGASFLSMATAGLLVQVVSIYEFTAALKWGNEWTRDGTALYYVLMNDQFVRAPGRWLLGFPDLCRWLTHGTLWLEMAGPLAAFIPWRAAWWRLLVVAAFWGLHLGMAICLRLGCFPLIMMVAWLPFVPALAWDFLARRRPAARARPPNSHVHPRPAPQFFAAFCMVLCLLWNLATVDYQRWNPLFPPWGRPVACLLRLDPWWSMFAPAPMTQDGWIVLDATLADGSHVDLLRHGQPVSYAKPPNLSEEAPDWKWHKLLFNLLSPPWAVLRERLGKDQAERWSLAHGPGQQVQSWTLVFMSEETLPHYMAVEPQRVELAKGTR